MDMDMAQTVRSARLAKGWTVERAAREATINRVTYKRIEDGLSVREDSLAKVLSSLGLAVGGPVHDADTAKEDGGREETSLLYQRPEGISDAEWDRVRRLGRAYIQGLLDAAADER